MLLRLLKFIALTWLGVLFMLVAGVLVIAAPYVVNQLVRGTRKLARRR
ncbi:MAG TPA: hypothetical protein VFM21_01985 [Terriglobia bacterium]|nr:hypothetical protein [Terriglobia bacterium]